MIGTIDIEINAAHPDVPLCEFAAFVGSPSHVRVRNVPRGVGNWQLTAVYLSVNYPDNSIPSVSLTHVGALWTGTIPGSAVAGRSVNGYQITADGLDESGNAITGYVLGVGDVIILNRDATITVNGVTYYLHLLDSVPETPKIGDMCEIDGSLKLYNGSAWVSFAAGSSIEIVAPSTDPADAGKAADAKATGDALAGKQPTITDLANIRAGATAGATAVQPSALAGYATLAQLVQKADVSALRYDKIDLGIASSRVQTDYTDPDNPIDYVTLPLTDRAVAEFTIDTTIAELRLTFPDTIAGKIRDFGLFIYIQDTIPAPALVPPSGVRFFTNDGKMPMIASYDDDRAYTLLYFSEQPYGNIFLVKGEEVKEVS